jgi:ribosomal protein L44E
MSARNGDKATGSPRPQPPRRNSSMKHSADREVCPKCGRPNARLIGRSETFPVLYLRCDDCNHTSVAPA